MVKRGGFHFVYLLIISISFISLKALAAGMISTGFSPQVSQKILAYLNQADARFSSLSEQELRNYFSFKDAKGNPVSLLNPEKPNLWALKDPQADGVEGTSTEKAYQEFKMRDPGKPVIVAVVDSGVDIHHEDLQGQIWTNEEGLHGWNFLGSRDGKNLITSNLEISREVGRLKKKETNQGLTPDEKRYQAILQQDYDHQKSEVTENLQKFQSMLTELDTALNVLRKVGLKEESIEAVQAIKSDEPVVVQAKTVALRYLSHGITTEKLSHTITRLTHALDSYFNIDFDPSQVIGDHPDQLDEVGYGNSDVITETADHGTHVAGIIGAVRDNGIGMNGQAKYVKIMSVRVVPDGDERDKDVANGIRYAVNHGAKIINMSFGKKYSPQKAYVDAAFKYAEEKGVLIVHAAGNDAANSDQIKFFPNRQLLAGSDGKSNLVKNWIEVGASSSTGDDTLPAVFSNYGSKTVDLFSPGVDIYSSIPGNKYAYFSGTSMASPEVAGVAALVLSQYPQMTAVEVKDLLMANVRKHDGLQVFLPGSGNLVNFSSLSITGGVVNAYNALKAAAEKVETFE